MSLRCCQQARDECFVTRFLVGVVIELTGNVLPMNFVIITLLFCNVRTPALSSVCSPVRMFLQAKPMCSCWIVLKCILIACWHALTAVFCMICCVVRRR